MEPAPFLPHLVTQLRNASRRQSSDTPKGSGWTAGAIIECLERLKRFAAAADPERSLVLAKGFIAGKIKNARTLLGRHLPADDERRMLLESQISLLHRAERAVGADTLLGVEGMAAKEYFAGLARLLKGETEFSLEGRNRSSNP